MGLPQRLGSFVSLPMSIMCLILFFLPWVGLTCNSPMGPMTMGKASGLQLITGDMTMEDSPFGGQQSAQEKKKSEDEFKASLKARPWFALGLLAPVGLLAAGAVGAVRRRKVAGVLVALAACGVLTTLLAAAVSYRDEVIESQKKQMAAQQPQPAASNDPGQAMGEAMGAMQQSMMKQVTENVNTETRAPVWISLVAYLVIAAAGLAELMMARPGAPVAGVVQAPVQQAASQTSSAPPGDQ